MYLTPAEQIKIETIGNYRYIGCSSCGSLDTSQVWQLIRLTLNNGAIVAVQWAGGNESPVNAWSDRATVVYS